MDRPIRVKGETRERSRRAEAENYLSDALRSSSPHRPEGRGRDAGVAAARGDGPGAGLGTGARGRCGSSQSRCRTARRAAPPYGLKSEHLAPSAVGRDFDLSSTILAPLEPFRNDITIVSNTDCKNAEAFSAPEIGGDHFRSAAVFLTQAHPKQTQGSDLHAGTSIDQLYASRFGQEMAIPSMQLCIENVDQAGGCEYGYSCAYTDSMSGRRRPSRCR